MFFCWSIPYNHYAIEVVVKCYSFYYLNWTIETINVMRSRYRPSCDEIELDIHHLWSRFILKSKNWGYFNYFHGYNTICHIQIVLLLSWKELSVANLVHLRITQKFMFLVVFLTISDELKCYMRQNQSYMRQNQSSKCHLSVQDHVNMSTADRHDARSTKSVCWEEGESGEGGGW